LTSVIFAAAVTPGFSRSREPSGRAPPL